MRGQDLFRKLTGPRPDTDLNLWSRPDIWRLIVGNTLTGTDRQKEELGMRTLIASLEEHPELLLDYRNLLIAIGEHGYGPTRSLRLAAHLTAAQEDAQWLRWLISKAQKQAVSYHAPDD